MALSQNERKEVNNFRLGIYLVGMALATIGAINWHGFWAGCVVLGILMCMGALFEKGDD